MLERRDFLKTLGLGTIMATGAALVGCDAQNSVTATQNPSGETNIAGAADVSFSRTVDVLIVGSGIAGFSAAMDPLDAGLSVLIADKQTLLGGESYYSNGVFRVSGSQFQLAAGVGQDVETAWTARSNEAGFDTDADRTAYQKRLFELQAEWIDRVIEDYGAAFADPTAYADAAEDLLLPKNGLGDMESIMTPINNSLAAKGLSTSLGIRATAFIIDKDSNVVGMRFRSEEGNKVMDVRAHAVIMAAGGFSGNQELVVANLPSYAEVGCLSDCAHSMGEGHELCVVIDGSMTDMDKADDLISDIPTASAWGLFAPVVQLNPAGRRFAPEDDQFAAANRCFSDRLGYWWTIFDNQLLSGVNSANVAKMRQRYADRIIGPFDDTGSLASAMDVPQETLESSLTEYDQAVQAGKDEKEGKTHFLQSLSAPYYAVKLFPKRFRTLGGASVDGAGRLVLSTESTPVENVFCCGAVAMGMSDGLATCAASGLLAGKSAVDLLSANS